MATEQTTQVDAFGFVVTDAMQVARELHQARIAAKLAKKEAK